MNILVYGGWFGSGNLGDEAILRGVKEMLKKKLPEASLTALSIDPEYTQTQTGVNAERIESPKTLLKNRDRYLKLFREADAHLLTGGTPFYDYGHLSRIIHMGLPALSQQKVYCFSVGSKPIKTLMGREITRILLKNTCVISTRDLISKQILQPLTGRIPKPVPVTGDSALLLDPVSNRKNNDLVLFCPRRLVAEHKLLYHEKMQRSAIDRIRHMQAITADRLIDDGYRVCFMPFHTVPPDDDREEIRVIGNLMRNEAEALNRPNSIESALETISETSLVVGLRLHSLIFAALQGTPFASVDYDIKIRGFMEHIDASSYLSRKTCRLEDLYERANLALGDKQEYSMRLRKRVNLLKTLINMETDRLVSALNLRNSGSRRL